jgi:kynurenine formamidase
MMINLTMSWGDGLVQADLSKGVDLSFPLTPGMNNPTAWYCGPVTMEPVKGEGFVGAVSQGGSVNFRTITFNPHGHGTHTESYGHIAPEIFPVNQSLTQFFFPAVVVTILPEPYGEDLRLTTSAIAAALRSYNAGFKAVIFRTSASHSGPMVKDYSHTNPPYLEAEAAAYLRDLGVEHLLIDLPSVDREVDGGALLAHRAFWNYPDAPREKATITELIHVPAALADGAYLLLLMLPNMENDAAPSRPILYPIQSV